MLIDNKQTGIHHIDTRMLVFSLFHLPINNSYCRSKSVRLTNLSVYDRSTYRVRDFNFLNLWIFVFHNADTFPPPLQVFDLSVVINTGQCLLLRTPVPLPTLICITTLVTFDQMFNLLNVIILVTDGLVETHLPYTRL